MRAGLFLMVSGYLLTVGYDVCKFAAVGARWAGLDWDTLSTDIARPVAAAAAPLIAIGFGLPLIVQHVSGPFEDWRRHRQLGSLWHSVKELTKAGRATDVPWWTSPGMRLLQRERDIHDALLTLNPYFDMDVRSSAHTQAVAAGAATHEADATADAAMILAALDSVRADPEHRVIASAPVLQEFTGVDSRSLIALSKALRHSPAGAGQRLAAIGRERLGE
jgi:hypothetical protein